MIKRFTKVHDLAILLSLIVWFYVIYSFLGMMHRTNIIMSSFYILQVSHVCEWFLFDRGNCDKFCDLPVVHWTLLFITFRDHFHVVEGVYTHKHWKALVFANTLALGHLHPLISCLMSGKKDIYYNNDALHSGAVPTL